MPTMKLSSASSGPGYDSIPTSDSSAAADDVSLSFRLSQGVPNLIGGILFFFGSLCYIPRFNWITLGGVLFTIGALGYVWSDFLEWWTNHQASQMRDDSDTLREVAAVEGEVDTSFKDAFRRSEQDINFFLSLFGSLLYLIGSVLFIHEKQTGLYATLMFIIGSIMIVASQLWKLLRHANYAGYTPVLNIEVTTGLGGLSYLVGSIMFLPSIDTTIAATQRAAVVFVIGGTFFLYSSCALACSTMYLSDLFLGTKTVATKDAGTA